MLRELDACRDIVNYQELGRKIELVMEMELEGRTYIVVKPKVRL